MTRILISEAVKQGGQATVAGFVRSLRVQKSLVFIDLADISGVLQLVVTAESPAFEIAKNLQLESVIKVTGALQAKPAKKDATGPEFEITVAEMSVLSEAAPELPIPVLNKADNEAEADNRFSWRWLDLRSADKQLIFKTWTELEKGFRAYWADKGFLQIYTPSFMNTASETGAEVFKVDYFGRPAYLAQSPQFYKQMAMAAGLEKVFDVGPVYRAEKSFTSRHSTEFTGWDFEMSFIESDQDVRDELSAMIISGFEKVKSALNLEIDIPTLPFPAINMKEAKERLAKKQIKSERPDDLNAEEEKALGDIIKEETGHDFFYLIDYPASARPFYHMRQEDKELTKGFDLFYKGLEIVTGAQREHRYDILTAQAKEKEMDLEQLEDYLNFFKFGCPPHGGAGIGPARIVMKMLSLPNIREATFLPRDVRRLRP